MRCQTRRDDGRESKGVEEQERGEPLWVGIMKRERESERARDKYQGSEVGGESMRDTDTVAGRRLLLFFRFVNSCPPLGEQHTLSSAAMHTGAEDGETRGQRRRANGTASEQRLSE